MFKYKIIYIILFSNFHESILIYFENHDQTFSRFCLKKKDLLDPVFLRFRYVLCLAIIVITCKWLDLRWFTLDYVLIAIAGWNISNGNERLINSSYFKRICDRETWLPRIIARVCSDVCRIKQPLGSKGPSPVHTSAPVRSGIQSPKPTINGSDPIA